MIGRVATCSQCLATFPVRERKSQSGSSSSRGGKSKSGSQPARFLMPDERPPERTPLEKPSQFGITLLVLGLGGFLLPHLGVQFKILNLLGEEQHTVAAALALAGGLIVAYSLRSRPAAALGVAALVSVLAAAGWSALPQQNGSIAGATGDALSPPPASPQMAPQDAPIAAAVVSTPFANGFPPSPARPDNPFSAGSSTASENEEPSAPDSSPPPAVVASPPESPFRRKPSGADDSPAASSLDAADLLGTIDPAKNSLNGTWTLQGTALTSPATVNAAQITTSTSLPRKYRLKLVAERVGGTDTSLCIGFPMGAQTGMVAFDGWGIPATALSLVDGRTGDNNATTHRGRVLKAGKNEIVLTVEEDRVRIEVNGGQVVDWKGNPGRLSLDTRFWKAPPAGRAFLGTWQTAFRISQMQVEPLDP
jgi:hypothetical protein